MLWGRVHDPVSVPAAYCSEMVVGPSWIECCGLKPEYKNRVEYPPDGHQNRRWMSYGKNARERFVQRPKRSFPIRQNGS